MAKLGSVNYYGLCCCCIFKIYSRVIQRSWGELGGITQGVVHHINKDTICPEDFMIEGLAQFHLFFTSPITNVPAGISCWPGFPFLAEEFGGRWAAARCARSAALRSLPSCCRERSGLGVKRRNPEVWAIKRSGCVMPYPGWAVGVNTCEIQQLLRVHHLGCPPSQPPTSVWAREAAALAVTLLRIIELS